MKKITFSRQVNARGKNGYLLCSGIEIFPIGFDEKTMLSPITSKGLVSDSCLIEIPTENIRELAATLIEIADELNLPGGEAKTVGGWTVQDVIDKAEEMDIELTEGEAEEIFESIGNNFDASMGINWDTVEDAINQHLNASED